MRGPSCSMKEEGEREVRGAGGVPWVCILVTDGECLNQHTFYSTLQPHTLHYFVLLLKRNILVLSLKGKGNNQNHSLAFHMFVNLPEQH